MGEKRSVSECEGATSCGFGGGGKVAPPDFISNHNHVGYTVLRGLFRGRAEDMGLGCVTGQIFPTATVASREEHLAVGSLTYAELLRSRRRRPCRRSSSAPYWLPARHAAEWRRRTGRRRSSFRHVAAVVS